MIRNCQHILRSTQTVRCSASFRLHTTATTAQKRTFLKQDFLDGTKHQEETIDQWNIDGAPSRTSVRSSGAAPQHGQRFDATKTVTIELSTTNNNNDTKNAATGAVRESMK